MDQLQTLVSMFPHLYGSQPQNNGLLTLPHLPLLYPPTSSSNLLLHRLTSPEASPTLPSPLTPTLTPTASPEIKSTGSRSSNIRISLDDKELWQQFHMFGTEMIVTRSGRRMFPILKTRVDGLDLNKKYFIILDIIPLDDARYKFCNGQWVISGRGEPHYPSRLFIHPDSPATGKHWMEEGLVSFHRVKLTNNNKDQSGNILLNSMHRYQPRIHVVEADDIFSMKWSNFQTFTFPETSFFAVTAYQNENITQLKIDNNPFAKGFRDREKVFPQKRSAPFLDQLREASQRKDSEFYKHKRDSSPLSESSEVPSPEKKQCTTSLNERQCMTDLNQDTSISLYNNTKLELIRQQITQQSKLMNRFANPLFPYSLNSNLPIMPFPLYSGRHRT